MNELEALELALTLAITAPTDSQAKEATKIAEKIAQDLDAVTIAGVQAIVNHKLDLDE